MHHMYISTQGLGATQHVVPRESWKAKPWLKTFASPGISIALRWGAVWVLSRLGLG